MPELQLESNGGYHVGDTLYFNHPTESWIRGTLTSIKRLTKKDGFTHVLYGCTPFLRDRYLPSLSDLPSTAQVYSLKEHDIHHIIESCSEPKVDNTLNDLLELSYLHDATLLEQVRVRYYENLIYTHIGPIMLALNPYDFKLPNYTVDKMPKYINEGSTVIETRSQNLPHAWTVAHYSYWRMCIDEQNQSIIVSGESGAGKTETSKIVVNYIGNVSTAQCGSQEKSKAEEITKKVTLTSPILEAFGNAKTKKNDNSSRFGKFMKVFFKKSINGGVMTGASIKVYLLERSRVVTHGKGERGYHSFYQLLACNGNKDKQQRLSELYLNRPENYHSTSVGEATMIDGVNDADDFDNVVRAMQFVGMSENELKNVWNIVGVVLHLLSLKFKPVTDDECCIDMDAKDALLHVRMIKELLGLPDDTFFNELTTTTLLTRGEIIVRKLRQGQSIDLCEGVAKALYEALFLWLVERINELIKPPKNDENNINSWIGLLDIFGFENFSHGNSFEQLCINLANETLQNHYNSIIFTRDIEECRKESINTESVVFYDNQPCLDLICGLDFSDCKPGGSLKITNKISILHLLDEESALAKGSDLTFREKICDTYGGRLIDGKGCHSNFLRVKTDRSSFIIKHYAGDVTYNVEGFRAKNSDSTKESLKDAIRSSNIPFISFLLGKKNSESSSTIKSTVSSFFKNQLVQLMTEINGTHPHWIRCIKPHSSKKPQMFNGNEVIVQMRSAGVLETVKIRQNSFSVRLIFSDFLKAHKVLLRSVPQNISKIFQSAKNDLVNFHLPFPYYSSDREAVIEIMRRARVDSENRGQVGKTKVFLKTEASQYLSFIVRTIQKGYTFELQSAICQAISRRKVHLKFLHYQLKIITSFLKSKGSHFFLRQKELRKKEFFLLKTFRGILLLQNDEVSKRIEFEKNETMIFSSILNLSREYRTTILNKLIKQKQQNDILQQVSLSDIEFQYRNFILENEIFNRSLISKNLNFAMLEVDARDELEVEEVLDRKSSLFQAYDLLKLQLSEWSMHVAMKCQSELIDKEYLYRKILIRDENFYFNIIYSFWELIMSEINSRLEILSKEGENFIKCQNLWNQNCVEMEKHWWERKSITDRREILLLQKYEVEVRRNMEFQYNISLAELLDVLTDSENTARRREEERLELEEEERMLLVEEELFREREEEVKRTNVIREAAQLLWRNFLEDEKFVKEIKRLEENIQTIRVSQAQLTREYMLLCRRKEIAKGKSGLIVNNASDMKKLDEYRIQQKNLSQSLAATQQILLDTKSKLISFRSKTGLQSYSWGESSMINLTGSFLTQEDVSLVTLRKSSVSEEGSMNLIHRMNVTRGMVHSRSRESSITSSNISTIDRLELYRKVRAQKKSKESQSIINDYNIKINCDKNYISSKTLSSEGLMPPNDAHMERNPFKKAWSPGVPDANGSYWVYTPTGSRVALVPMESLDLLNIHVMDSEERGCKGSPDPYVPYFSN